MLMHAKSHLAAQGGGEGAGEAVGANDIASARSSSSAEELFATPGTLGGWSMQVTAAGCIGSGADAGGLARLGKVILTMPPGWVLSGASSSILSSL